LRWWVWNTDNPLNHPMLAWVPMTSVFIFATFGPIYLAVLAILWGSKGCLSERPRLAVADLRSLNRHQPAVRCRAAFRHDSELL
jgi:hypothetical protein